MTLDAPSFLSVMQHAKNRSLREEVYRAYITRASSGEMDNTPIIDQILKLRLEKAKILNFNNFAEVCPYILFRKRIIYIYCFSPTSFCLDELYFVRLAWRPKWPLLRKQKSF